ncbi:hypothetical protein H5410_029775 [Solanum commersonii]|uniref:DUF1985 domain-containing protein n=1 Tax=Solanum commersonii TaxID=4109 RepID=A0A9J5YE74_SOLCO|nr:hypothetical protein H5410_029775 [Solanum commersonii]
MYAQSPSKRFTRGIPLLVENSVERLSFSLGLTQDFDFGEVSGSMSKSNTMQEIKSKLKNNPIRLEGTSAKSKQSNIKIVEGEENAKRKEVVVSGLLEHDEAVKFLGKREPTRIPHMQCYTNIEVMKVIRRCHVQAQLIRCMFLRELEGSSKDAILIHVNDTTLRFTIRDFAIITGLKCSDNENDFVFNTEEPNKIILQYFGVEKAITKNQLVEKFDNKVWGDNDDDAVKFAILFYIHSFILSEEPTSTVIDRKDFDLVESGRYIDYPWGKKAFDLRILHLHTKIKHDGRYFKLYGFPLALQVSHHIPRILNWKTKKDFPRLSYFAKGMFRDDNNSLVFKNITPTPMELKILELPSEYVQSDSSPIETTTTNALDDDFQDPLCPINNKGKEKVDTCLSPPKKKSRQTITPIQNKTTPRVISKQPCLIKSPRRANVAKRPKSPLPKRQAKKHANVPSYTGIKQNVEIKSSVAFELPSTSKSHNFKPSQHLPSELKCQSVFNDLNDQEVVRVSVPSSTLEVSIHQSNLHSPAGQSVFSPLVQQFSNLEPQGHNNSGVPINFKVQNTSNIFEVQNNFEDLLNVIHDQTEKIKKEEFTDTNKAGSSNVNELVVEEVLMCPAPLQMVHDDQPNINPERSIVLHPLLAVDEHTPLPIHRKRRPGPFNTLPYVTSFGSESDSSSRFHFSFDLKHPFVAMSDLERTTLNGKEEQYKKNKSVLQMWFHFGIVIVQNKNWFYSLAYKNQLLDDSHVDVILYYIRKRAKYSDTNAFSFITVDCNFSNLITNVWDAYYNFESNINKERDLYCILIIVSINDRSIQIYDSLRGGALHDSSVANEIKKYAQLIPMYLSKSDFYGKKGIDISSHPNDCGLYVAAYADHISNGNRVPNSFDSEFTRIQYASLLWNYGVQKIQAGATTDNAAPERPIKIHRDCDSSEKITIN